MNPYSRNYNQPIIRTKAQNLTPRAQLLISFRHTLHCWNINETEIQSISISYTLMSQHKSSVR